jgi:hypothetical protein
MVAAFVTTMAVVAGIMTTAEATTMAEDMTMVEAMTMVAATVRRTFSTNGAAHTAVRGPVITSGARVRNRSLHGDDSAARSN